jgi:uncharacterized membrane-anchored protein YitT (DUF2179 family)
MDRATRHHLHDDAQALMTGTLFVALGVLMFNHAGLLSGGTAGLALLVHYATGWAFGPVYFIVNLPFCLLAWKRLGRRFTAKTLLSAALLAVFVQWLPAGLGFQTLSAPVASVLGGLLAGAGMLMLFRHHASLGGFNVTALMLQDRLGWRAGWVQLAMDAAVLVAALAIATPERVGWSVVAALATNLALAINHRPGRYSVA